MSEKVRVLHVLALDTVGGIECLFGEYLAASLEERLEHHVLVTRRPVIPRFREALREHTASVHMAKYMAGVKLPSWPKSVRRRRLMAIARKIRPDVVLLYNCLGSLLRARMSRQVTPPAVNVYYERGSAWARHNKQVAARFLYEMDGVICNSRAAQRVLELGWDCPPGKSTVCHNGLRLAPPPADHVPRRLPAKGPIRIGFVGRLVPFKGPALALQTMAALRGGGSAFELNVAGDGPQMDSLKALASKLNVLGSVRFHGIVADMAAFYSHIHLLLCPSLREPLGNVCMEAGFYGCPVVATEVDGIPEIVEHGRTGYCVPFSLPLSLYQEMGGGTGSMPGWVYDPRTDTLTPPRIPSPEQLAQAVLQACDTDAAFRRMSRRAHIRTRDLFSMKTYTASLDGHLLALAEAGKAEGVDSVAPTRG